VIKLTKADLQSPNKFKRKFWNKLVGLSERIRSERGMDFGVEEVGDLLLSACRSNDFDIVLVQGKCHLLQEEKVWEWFDKKIIPNTVVLGLDDEDVLRLLIFSIEMTYQMFLGGTRATVSAKGFRERRRTFEAILADQFTGKFGEIALKKFLEKHFPYVRIELDWEISRHLEKYRNDILNAKKKVSIKSSPALSGVWAEADEGYDYGVMVKCCVPQPTILQFFIEVCGFSRLLDFAEARIPQEDATFKGYLNELKERIGKYKCGVIQTSLKGIICGYFHTKQAPLVREGETLEYLGKVRETRHLINIRDLKWTMEDWRKFVMDLDLC
jgi:hypothetical protein